MRSHSLKVARLFGCLLLALSVISTAYAGSAFKFVVITDPHISVAGPKSPPNGSKMFKNSEELLGSALNEINAMDDIDFVIVLGDLTKDAEPWNLDRFKEMMDELKVPYYVVLGNHDVSLVDTDKMGVSAGVSRPTMIWAFQGHGYNGPGSQWSCDPLPGIHLIGLDSSCTGDWDGRISNSGLQFLERDLAANPGKLTIVALHHQLTNYCNSALVGENDFDKFVLRNAEDVKKIIKKHPQVVMTLSGHRHISTRYKKEDQVSIFTCPSTMTWPMRYVVFEVDNKKISYTTNDVKASPEIWAEAKKNIMEDRWWHPENEHPMTAEGNEKFVAFMLSEATKSGVIPYSSETLKALER